MAPAASSCTISTRRHHLIDEPAMRGIESLGDGYVERELGVLREVAARLS